VDIYVDRRCNVKRVYVLVMAITISFSAGAQQHQSPDMVLVEGGSFRMGSDNGEAAEKPVHTVTVKSFYMGRTEVTQKEWKEIMGNNPSGFRGDTLPVEQVSWYEAIEYCNKLSLKEGLTPVYRGSGDDIACDFSAAGYRLPTNAEWEYASRGGDKDYNSTSMPGVLVLTVPPGTMITAAICTHQVGTKQPNSLGLYDMNGNVWEWCWDDWYGSYSGRSQSDPTGASMGTDRVIRGGGWGNTVALGGFTDLSVATPSNRIGNLGFRVVRSKGPFAGGKGTSAAKGRRGVIRPQF
jgi:formylglycine-generating enzyme required for sulfatase activity